MPRSNPFHFVPPSPDQVEQIIDLRSQFATLYEAVMIATVPGHYQTLCIDDLITAFVYASKAMGHDLAAQLHEGPFD
jgi:hypothetical protein